MTSGRFSFGGIMEFLVEGLQAMSLQLFLMTLLAILPLFMLARRRIYPDRMLLVLMLVPSVSALLLLLVPAAMSLILLIDAVIILLMSIDLLTLSRYRDFSVSRKLERVTSLSRPHAVEITVNHHRTRRAPFLLRVRDDLPQEFDATPEESTVEIAGRCRAVTNYRFVAQKRGAFRLGSVHLQVSSHWRLWKRLYSYSEESDVHVYPNMVQLSEYAVLARTNRLSLMGVRKSRKIGQDHEFERLRDYTLDDNYKHIDWRTTARRTRLTVKEFQSSQSQRLVFLLDCGRMMQNTAGGLTLLDHALNAMLMLSFVALRQGDSVGMICFSDRIHNFVPARGGMSQMNQLLHASFDRFPELVESRYDLAFLHLASRFRKRALVVLVSNVVDEVNRTQVVRYLRGQVGRHLPLGVLLRDHQLFDAAEVARPAGNELYRAAAAAEILNWRRQMLTELEHQGVLTLDVFPEEMTAPLVNRYLTIKARHLL